MQRPASSSRWWGVLVVLAFLHTPAPGIAQSLAPASEGVRAISPAGLLTKWKLAVAWLFHPPRLDSVVGFHAYPVGPEPLCYGRGVQGYEPGVAAVVRRSPDEERYASGQVWEAPSPARNRSLSLGVADGRLCVATIGLGCQAPPIDRAASCLFLAEHAIEGTTPTAKFWIDLGTDTFYRGSVEASLPPR